MLACIGSTDMRLTEFTLKNFKGFEELEWSNFALGCVNCNSTKSYRDVDRSQFVLPDQDNSFRAFQYTKCGSVLPSNDLNADTF